MIFKDLCGEKVSMLGFGTMRLPMKDGEIDQAELEKMTDYAVSHGINYFDTAYPYHGGMSEVAIGKALSKYERSSYFLANKYPGHQISERYDPEEIFEEQLKKCGTDHFDFYLLHNVYENSAHVYLDERWGIIDYFKEQKRRGRIKHLGFSSHARRDSLEKFLDTVGDEMEFCQIQLNYLDYTLQDAKGKAELLNKRNIPIIVMEPVRGGKLCSLPDEDERVLKEIRPSDSIASWGFRFLQNIEGVSVVLSGMSNFAQMADNAATFEKEDPLDRKEWDMLLDMAEKMKSSVPCTACRYCTDGCPKSLPIPELIATYNELLVDAKTNPIMWLDGISPDRQPSSCIGCKKCEKICPQMIKISSVMKDLSLKLLSIPKWADVCKEREEAAKRNKAK